MICINRNSIPTVRHVFVSRDGYEDEPTIEEHLNYIVINGQRLDKPFVEKPGLRIIRNYSIWAIY